MITVLGMKDPTSLSVVSFGTFFVREVCYCFTVFSLLSHRID